MDIDKVFIINLKHRTDRKAHILDELKKVDIKNYEFFNAIQPTQEDIKNWNPAYLNPLPAWFSPFMNRERYIQGSLGCLKSHVEIMKESLKRGYKKILILEDDTVFNIPSQLGTFDNMMKFIHNQMSDLNYGLFYFCGSHKKDKISMVKNNIFKTEGTGTTGSYIITENMMKYIVENIVGYTQEIDVYYIEVIQKNFNCYCIMPQICSQMSSYSDIVGRVIKYDFNNNTTDLKNLKKMNYT